MAKTNGLEIIKFKLTGTAPLIMHSGRLADPLDPLTKAHKALTGKKKKQDEDQEAIAQSEWYASLYLNDDGKACMPSENIEAMLAEAAAANRLKKKFKAGVFLDGDFQLIYNGPSDAKALWDAGFKLTVGVKVMSSRIMRTRPMFKEWAVECTVNYFPAVVSKQEVIDAMNHASMFVGLGDWRPRFGRFSVEVLK